MQASSKILIALAALAFVQVALSAPKHSSGENGSPKKSNFFSRLRKPSCFGGRCPTDDDLYETGSSSQQSNPQKPGLNILEDKIGGLTGEIEHESLLGEVASKQDVKKAPADPISESQSVEPILKEQTAYSQANYLGASSPQEVDLHHDVIQEEDDHHEIKRIGRKRKREEEETTNDDESLQGENVKIPRSFETEMDKAMKSSIKRSKSQNAPPDDIADQAIQAVLNVLARKHDELILELSVAEYESIMREAVQRATGNHLNGHKIVPVSRKRKREVISDDEDDLPHGLELRSH